MSLDAGAHRIVADVSSATRAEFRRGAPVTLAFPMEACRVVTDQTERKEATRCG